MRDSIKRYELGDNININLLELNNFRKGGFIKEIPCPKYFYNVFLIKDIELHIEIGINEDGTFNFDDYDNVYVLDDSFGQPYYPFYDDKEEFDILKKVIFSYNKHMDFLVSKGILKEKIIREENNIKKILK